MHDKLQIGLVAKMNRIGLQSDRRARLSLALPLQRASRCGRNVNLSQEESVKLAATTVAPNRPREPMESPSRLR
ncbi:MAG: hypothetical protein CMJ58_01990 [Planctomycetaceae bacterium]|nr:hypothetical protein [Planctomycetaceae bacterium]